LCIGSNLAVQVRQMKSLIKQNVGLSHRTSNERAGLRQAKRESQTYPLIADGGHLNQIAIGLSYFANELVLLLFNTFCT